MDVASLIRGMAELLGSTLGPRIKLVVELAEGLPFAKADANQIEMAILNLSVNARDAMEQGGTLRIAADARLVESVHQRKLKPGAYLRISVSDTGCGMDEEVMARAVEPFFSTKGVGKGTGLGLSMVHGLASQLGGALTFPVAGARGPHRALAARDGGTRRPASRRDRDHPRARRGAVLLVDDEAMVRMNTCDMLTEMEFSVIEAASAEQALQLLNDGLPIDLLMTDHLMAGMSGVELAARWARGGRRSGH